MPKGTISNSNGLPYVKNFVGVGEDKSYEEFPVDEEVELTDEQVKELTDRKGISFKESAKSTGGNASN